ncbi:hypothetical protein [Agathobaculum sp.]|uniref:hypothetical protein n=1 Tax=Agathobaculum sp. TaxID=2048138 RepID=UPI002A821D47|nr:hypothetical protein [Agathobaculum sp.]MDY3617485.1 hypothetical protein [Agathobaculum sp.]
MKKYVSRFLSALLCAALLLPLLPGSARALTLTAVNDTLLPLSDATMPSRLGGELYVPYSVFTSLGVSASSEDNVLSLSSGGETLSFSPDEGYVYDQNMNSFSSPAYNMNGTVYVPVKLCCGKFGLTYSTFSASGETVLRITDGGAQSDSAFASNEAGSIENAVNAYKGITPKPEGGGQVAPPEKPAEPPIPPVEEKPSMKPARVYLAFFGPTSAETPAVLDSLKAAGRLGTFFLAADASKWDDDAVRRIVAEGHTPALLLYAATEDAPEELIKQLSAANERLAFLTGAQTRIVSNADGCARLTEAQRDAVVAAGYRLWDSTLESQDDKQRGQYVYAATAQRFASTTSTIVLRLRHSKAAAEAIPPLSSYMARQGIPTSRVTLNTTPINEISDIR